MMFPMMFSPVLVGFQFKFIFNDNVGLVNNALQSLGLTDVAIPWLVDGHLAMFSIIFAEIWTSTSVFAILILAGLYAIPQDPMEAAKVDGCTPWQSFRFVTLPFLMPFIYIAMAIRSLDVARACDIVQIMTNGGPAHRTALYADRTNGLCRCADGIRQCHGLYRDPAVDLLHHLFLPQADGRPQRTWDGGVTWPRMPNIGCASACCASPI